MLGKIFSLKRILSPDMRIVLMGERFLNPNQYGGGAQSSPLVFRGQLRPHTVADWTQNGF